MPCKNHPKKSVSASLLQWRVFHWPRCVGSCVENVDECTSMNLLALSCRYYEFHARFGDDGTKWHKEGGTLKSTM